MEKSRSLIQQVIGHKMLFVVFLLFLTDIFAEVVATPNETNHVNTTASLTSSPFPASPQKTEEHSMTSVVSPHDAPMPGNLTRSLSTAGQPKLSFSTAPQVSKQDTLAEVVATPDVTNHVNTRDSLTSSPFPASPQKTEEHSMTSVVSPHDAPMPGNLTRSLSTAGQPKLSFSTAPQVFKQESQPAMPVTTAVPEDTSSSMRNETVSIKENHPPTEATQLQKSKPSQKEVPSKTVTPHFDNEIVTSPTKDLETRSQGGFFEKSPSTIAYPETTQSTEPKDDRKGTEMSPSQAVPKLTQTPETGSHYMSGPFITSLTPINDVPIFDSTEKSPSGKKNSVIILAVVFSILLLIGLLTFLYFRRRHHSGSTSFNSPEWAGQATLPDDTGLDKDMEQQVGSVGEGETRRGTLVTFFGKRQSRVPSIAMEDINGKGGKEETEKLLCGEAEKGSPSEAIGDANGKVPKPLKESSQESPASNKD